MVNIMVKKVQVTDEIWYGVKRVICQGKKIYKSCITYCINYTT